jgi:voltage-gated potassium channel
MVREEVRRLVAWSERHRRLLARLLIAFGLSVVVDLTCAALMWSFESGLQGSDIHGFGDAVFFATVQILTVSSSLKNPVTHAGQIVDVVLEVWAIFVVTAVAGSFASFFMSGDQAQG